MNSTAACASSGCHLRRARQVLHVALLQQRQVTVHNQRCHFHAAPPLVDLGLGLGAEAAMRIRRPVSGPAHSVQMAKLVLLRRNLNRQALAQVARAHAGRIETAAPARSRAESDRASRPRRTVAIGCASVSAANAAEGRGQLFFARCQVPVFVQIADHELGRFEQRGDPSSELPAATPGDRTKS